jgi:hypothetical protein
MSSSSDPISLTSHIDTVLVPQGAEYQAVCRGAKGKTQAFRQILPIPVGILPLKRYLDQWQQTEAFVHQPPKGILLMGLGGSLSPKCEVGETILLQEYCLIQAEKFPQQWQKCHQHLCVLVYHHLQKQVRLGKGVTSDRVIISAQEKQRLGAYYQADVVDMEGIALLGFCDSFKIPVVILRVISDNCQQNLPDLTSAIAPDGSLNPWKLAYQMGKNPINSLHLIQGSLKGLRQLQRVTQALVK